jgi:hypothetical protein
MAIAAGVALAAGVIAMQATAAAAASKPAISLQAKPKAIRYREPAPKRSKLKGALASGKKGVNVTLLASRWPFHHSPKAIATTTSGRGGKFGFNVRPKLATRYVAKAGHHKSKRRTVSVAPGYTTVSCVVSGTQATEPCSNDLTVPPGSYTVTLSGQLLYPPSAYPTEKSKSFYAYYGQRNGSNQHPQNVGLVRKTAQQPVATGTTSFTTGPISITVPSGAWSFFVAGCTQTSVKSDGIGLPGKPGSHGCGKQTITYKQAKGIRLG